MKKIINELKTKNNLLTIGVWFKFICAIDLMKTQSQTDIAKAINVTYSHSVEIVKLFESKKWITTEFKGRERILCLTSKGKIIRDMCIKLKDLIF